MADGLLPDFILQENQRVADEIGAQYTADLRKAFGLPPPGAKASIGADDHAWLFGTDAEFREADHPRAENGKFGSGSGKGGASAAKPSAAPKPKPAPVKPGEQVQIPAEHFNAGSFYARHNDAQATPESVLSGFPTDTAAKIADTIKRVEAAGQTIDQFKANGEWTPERKKLHATIMQAFLSPAQVAAATPAPGEKPTFTVLGGRGGSGKSWFEHRVFDPEKAIVLDADRIKGMIPQYEGWNAAQVHEESGELFDQMTKNAQELGLNIVHDATMKSQGKAVALVNAFKGQGYRVEAHYMHLPRQEAAKRAVGRFLNPESGRFVPPEVVLSNTGNEASFDAVKGLVDAWSFRDNNVARGQPPKLISEGANDAKA